MYIALFVIVGLALAFLFVWLTAEYLFGYYLYYATLDVYGVLSFNFEPFDIVQRKVQSSECVYFQKALDSFPFKIIALKKGLDSEEGRKAVLVSALQGMETWKMVEITHIPFVDDEEGRAHPSLRGLTEADFQMYREKQEKYDDAVKQSLKVRDLAVKEGVSEKIEDFQRLYEFVKEIFQTTIPCVRKLPTGRTKKTRMKFSVAPLGAAAKVKLPC